MDGTARGTGWLGWTAAGVVAAALVGYAVFRPTLKDGGGGGTGGGTGGGFEEVVDDDAARVVIEMERPARITDAPPVEILRLDRPPPAGFAPEVQKRLEGAAGGAALFIGPEKFNDNWKEKMEKGQVRKDAALFGHADAAYPGFARYDFRVPATANYEIWVRAFWVDDCGNSLDLAVNDGVLFTMTDSNVGRWTWRRLETGEREARRFRLDADADHTLTLCNREDDCYIDQILIRDADANLPDPVGAVAG